MATHDDAQLQRDSRPLHAHGPLDVAREIEETAAWCRANGVTADVYGAGAFLNDFEARVAELLGFEAARFLPSGTMAQLIAMRVYCERAKWPQFGMHPTSHLELHEERGYARLHGLHATLVGPRETPLLAAHLAAVNDPLSALLIELPIRETGGRLPSWEQLDALKQTARGSKIPLHLDGARLWECGAAYGRTLSEITAGFSSVYVSFYKGIGALPGCMLLGTRGFIDEATVWQRRCGGNLYTQTPNAASAARQLDTRLARMPELLARARLLAEALRTVPGVTIVPDPPDVNLFHVVLALSPKDAVEARLRVARAHGIWVFGGLRESFDPSTSRFELYVGEAVMGLEVPAIRAAFAALFT